MSSPTPLIQFYVTVNPESHTYTFYTDIEGTTLAESTLVVTEPNTVISYTLIKNEQQLGFVGPIISGDADNDLTFSISNDRQTIIFVDSDHSKEDICMKLVTAPLNCIFVSPDPQMINRRPG